jgi:hypothetical protein
MKAVLKHMVIWGLVVALGVSTGIKIAGAAGAAEQNNYTLVEFDSLATIDNTTGYVLSRTLYDHVGCEVTTITGTGVRNAVIQGSIGGSTWTALSTTWNIDPSDAVNTYKRDVDSRDFRYLRMQGVVGFNATNAITFTCTASRS